MFALVYVMLLLCQHNNSHARNNIIVVSWGHMCVSYVGCMCSCYCVCGVIADCVCRTHSKYNINNFRDQSGEVQCNKCRFVVLHRVCNCTCWLTDRAAAVTDVSYGSDYDVATVVVEAVAHNVVILIIMVWSVVFQCCGCCVYDC